MPRYSEIVFDHCRNPRNAGRLVSADVVGTATLHGHAPRVSFYLHLADDTVQSITFSADGCGVVIAAGSVLSQLATAQTIEYCQNLDANVLIENLGGLPKNKRYCVQLAIDALQDALAKISSEVL